MDGTARTAIRVAVHSHRRLLREALTAFLDGRPDFEVVGQTASFDCLIELCSLRRPQVAIVDTDTLCPDTVEHLAAVRSTFPGIDIVLAYGQVAPHALEAALRAGITTLVPGSRGLTALVRVVQHHAGRATSPALD